MANEIIRDRRIVVVNQAVNYLTIGYLNEFAKKFEEVSVITGSIHSQGENLLESVKISMINKFSEDALLKKLLNWLNAFFRILFLLLTKYRKHEIIFIPNPPIAYLMMLTLPHKFSILLWDVYPDIFQIFGIDNHNIFYRFWVWSNKRLFKRAYRVFTIGHKISEVISQYVSKEKITIVPLWTTFQGFTPISDKDNFFIQQNKLEGKFLVQYSGNIGVTHNVEVLALVAQKLKNHDHIHFQIIGRGNRYNQLKQKIRELNLENLDLLPFQKDEVFPYSLSAADLGVVVLDEKTSKGSVPSKTYNLMIAGKPILYIASRDSELFEYAINYNNGACFESTEIKAMANYILNISKDTEKFKKLASNSKRASANFRRGNAKLLVDRYIGS